MQYLGRLCVIECILLLIVENLLLHDSVERTSIEFLPLFLYTVDIYKNYDTFPVQSMSSINLVKEVFG